MPARVAAMPSRNWFQRAVERLLPWYDPEEEEQRAERSTEIHRLSIEARVHSEATTARVEAGGLGVGLREGYRQTGQRLQRS